jgi:hypothetical protein
MLFDRCCALSAVVARRGAMIASLIPAITCITTAGNAQRLAPYLADRGTGIATSMFGEYVYALEYLKRLSPAFRFYTGIEGNQDEVEWIVEGQYRLTRRAHLKLNTAFGLTSKAPDFAPEIGIMFNF